MTGADSYLVDFFVSYTRKDVQWAEWIAWQLEDAGYTCILQKWDFQPGGRVGTQINAATRRGKQTLAVLSEAYLSSEFAEAEWTSAFQADPTGRARSLVPVRVSECEPLGLLGTIVYIDLVGVVDEAEARGRLIAGVNAKRGRPAVAPPFPAESALPAVAEKPEFPLTSPPEAPATPFGPPPEPAPAPATHPPETPVVVTPLAPGRPPKPGSDVPWRAIVVGVALLAIVAVVVAVVVWLIHRPGDSPSDATFTQVGVSPRSVALGSGSPDLLWIADVTQPEAWWLVEDGGRVRTRQAFLAASSRPTAVAVDVEGGSVWVTDQEGRAWKIDLASRRRTLMVNLGRDAQPLGIAIADGVAWTANRDGTISRFDASNGRRLDGISLNAPLTSIAAGDDAIWVTDAKDGTVWRIDPRTLAPDIKTSQGPRAVAVGAGAAWVANSDGTVTRFDDDGATTIKVTGGPLCGIAVGEGAVWVTASDDDDVWRIDPETNKASGDPIKVEDGPCAVAAGAGSVWVANRLDSSISRIAL